MEKKYKIYHVVGVRVVVDDNLNRKSVLPRSARILDRERRRYLLQDGRILGPLDPKMAQ